MDIYRLTQSFVETETSWSQASTASAWTSGGGDYVGSTGVKDVSPYASRTGLQDTGWFEWNVTDLVAEWHEGTNANHGMALLGSENTTLTFTSREGLAAGGSNAFTPELVVEHEPVPEPASLLAVAGGVAALARRRKRL